MRILLLVLFAAAVIAGGCARSVDNAESPRTRTNLDYWNAINDAIRDVNLARSGGAEGQLHAVELAIEELRRLPTDNVDSELVDLGRSTINFFEGIQAFLKKNAGTPDFADPTASNGSLHTDEVKWVEQGKRTQSILSERYHMAFRGYASRDQESRQQPNAKSE